MAASPRPERVGCGLPRVSGEADRLANQALDVFRSYRVYDDFEERPLHGTFVIDGKGLVRWQDISYEPFTDAKFVLEETQRLLSLP